MIGSWAKYWQLPPEQILYEVSHANLVLFGAAIPSFENEKESDRPNTENLQWGGKLDYDNPDNFTDTDTDRVRV